MFIFHFQKKIRQLQLKIDQTNIALRDNEKNPYTPFLLFVFPADVSAKDGDLYPAVSMVYGLTEATVELKSSTYDPESTNISDSEKTLSADENRMQPTATDCEDTDDEKCLTTTTSLHDTDAEDKAIIGNRCQSETLKENKDKAEDNDTAKESRKEGGRDDDNDDNDDDELEEEVALASLPETERHLLTIGHAWDDIARAGRIHLHPNAPDVCIPARTFGDKVQGLRSKRPLKKGRHCWLLKEIRVYEPGLEDEERPNNLIIGIG